VSVDDMVAEARERSERKGEERRKISERRGGVRLA
jgi:hypothetical protein